MKTTAFAAALALLTPTAVLAQTPPRLINPADADRDGVVTEDEKADYLAKKAAGVQDQPPAIGVGMPKPGGLDTIVMGRSGSDPSRADGAAGEPPAAASEFEKSVEAGIRKDARDD